MKNFVFILLLFSVCSYAQLTGQSQWQSSIGLPLPNEVANCVKSTSDGGYIIGGSLDNKILVVKTDSAGNSEWQVSVDSYFQNRIKCVQQTLDGGYIVVGTVQSNAYGALPDFHGGADICVMKLTSAGVISWQKCLGGSSAEEGNSVKQTPDGGYIIAGSTRSTDGDIATNHPDMDFWIIKLNSAGTIVWQKLVGGTTPSYSAYNLEEANEIQLTADGGYIVVGFTDSENSGVTTGSHSPLNAIRPTYDYWIVKLNSIGTMEWQKCYGGTNDDVAKNVIQTLDGGFLVSGTSSSTDGDVPSDHRYDDAWLLKLNATGTIEWQSPIENVPGWDVDKPGGIVQMADGSYYVGGTASLDFILAKFDVLGNLIWRTNFDNSVSNTEVAYSIDKTLDGGIIMAGYHDIYYDPQTIRSNILLVKVNEVLLGITDHLMQKPITIYPIPASNIINVRTDAQWVGASYVISDQAGRAVINGKVTNENSTITIENLSRGFYIFSIGNNAKFNTKIIKN